MPVQRRVTGQILYTLIQQLRDKELEAAYHLYMLGIRPLHPPTWKDHHSLKQKLLDKIANVFEQNR